MDIVKLDDKIMIKWCSYSLRDLFYADMTFYLIFIYFLELIVFL